MTRDEDAAPTPALFDRRIVERNIKRGLTTRKDYDKYLKSLADAADKVKSPDEEMPTDDGPEGNDSPAPTPPVSAG
jgi:hypothetical protein